MFDMQEGGRLETLSGITVVAKGPFILDLFLKKLQHEVSHLSEVFRKQNL